ncbi:MAG: RNA-binding protein [Acidobacteria bacterium]|nr:RNA-binding protein [Acidobacteriota bacterium]
MKLYVGNLTYSLAETELQSWFTEHGVALDSLAMMRDRFTGDSRGFAFVEIYDDEAAQQAIESCNGQDCHGRPLVINEARPKAPSFGGGGGGEGYDRAPSGGGDRPSRGGGGDRPSRGGKGGSRRNTRDQDRQRW